MNWNRLQTYGLSSEKSFEMLCNQLFENWCKETYMESLSKFVVVNGAGGDGGVESYAVLLDGSIIGLQAKWFLSCMEQGQINQIRKSLRTAIKIRPEITKYIVCIPRDLASVTGRGVNTESKRWDDFVNEMTADYPSITVELWTDARITAEIQKPNAAGILKYWFLNPEIDHECIVYSFEKAKSSWLDTKYVPDLSVPGQITRSLIRYIGDFDSRYALSEQYANLIDLCEQFRIATDELIAVSANKNPEIVDLLSKPKDEIHGLQMECERLRRWFSNEYEQCQLVERKRFFISFDSIIRTIRSSPIVFLYHFHVSDVLKILNKLCKIDFLKLLSETEGYLCNNIYNQSVIILGDPGTGKTHGVSSFVENQLNQHYHIPIIIQARSIPENQNWRDIIISVLGLSNNWSEDELWQALLSAANRSRFQDAFIKKSISVCPKVLIVVDGLDESVSHEKWVNRIKEANAINGRYPQIKFCFTSRPTAFPGLIDYAEVISLEADGDVPVSKLFKSYTRAYGIIIQNGQWARYALNTPLALKLFCELYRGQSITVFNLSDVSMDRLWRSKIDRIQSEYNRKTNASPRNQDIIIAIRGLSKCFVENTHIEREMLISAIENNGKIDDAKANVLLDHLESYGIIGSFCQKGDGLCPDRYIYYTGIQGYFDYAVAVYLIDEYKHPNAIDFRHCNGISINMLYGLAIISIQKYRYLITNNPTIDNEDIDDSILSELQFYALRHSDFETAKQFRDKTFRIMRDGANSLTEVVNKLVLPLSRITGHPLGVSMLDEYLWDFDLPAHRDVVWSLPAYLQKSDVKAWWKSDNIALLDENNEEYALTEDDLSTGLPIVYAWMLSNVSNPNRKRCRDELMAWAQKTPQEFFSLLLHFAKVNDPQIKSDLFSILMCLVYDCADTELIRAASTWIINNILSPELIDQNRDISVRYYSIAIVEKAIMEGVLTDEEVEKSLPPYHSDNTIIELNKDALTGTRMRGYSAINYDLARYVLIDHFVYDFNSHNYRQLDILVKTIASKQAGFAGMTSGQFILSAAYAFVLQMGWNEDVFYNYDNDENGNYVGGADCSIAASFNFATHGAQSSVMTICEKYVWQARNYISGFLCDRLLYGDEQSSVSDYSILDSFLIPIQEMHQIDPDDLPNDCPWYIPEDAIVIINERFDSKKAISDHIKNAADINWEKWIDINNADCLYHVSENKLLALSLFSCFYNSSGIRVDLFINSIIIPISEVSAFVKAVHDRDVFSNVCNPTDWNGGVDSACYITPKEICWFPWKKHYDSYKCDEFPDLTICSAVDSCCYNYPEYSDVYYYMPSVTLRKMLGIIDTDGYLFYDKGKNVVSEYSIAGEKWRTTQEYVLVGKDTTLKKLQEHGLTLIWITQEIWRETGDAQERFGEFFTEKRQYSICYYKGGELITERLITEVSENLKEG